MAIEVLRLKMYTPPIRSQPLSPDEHLLKAGSQQSNSLTARRHSAVGNLLSTNLLCKIIVHFVAFSLAAFTTFPTLAVHVGYRVKMVTEVETSAVIQ